MLENIKDWRKKMKINRLSALAAFAITLVLAGCSPSEEKLAEAQEARAQLVAAHDAAEERYLDIADTSLRAELDQLGVKVTEIEEMDFSKLSNKKVDQELLPQISELMQSYETVQAKLDGTYQEETAINEEAAKNLKISAYMINKTGLNLTGIVLHDITQDTYSNNYITEGEVISDGYTLMGVTLEVFADSTNWEFIITDENGTQYTLPCESLVNVSDKGVSLVFEYNSETNEAGVTFGGYFSN